MAAAVLWPLRRQALLVLLEQRLAASNVRLFEGNCVPTRRSLWLWAGIVLAVGIVAVVVLQATGNGDSGQNDGPGQVFLLCVILVIVLSATAEVRHWRSRRLT
jgi:4-amino-4-deoxy-L-arabinose transferase-like glycosyltransferase